MPKMTPEEIRERSESARLLARVELTAYACADSTRVELFVFGQGDPTRGRLVWQYARPAADSTTEAVIRCANALARSAEYLERRGFTGLDSQ